MREAVVAGDVDAVLQALETGTSPLHRLPWDTGPLVETALHLAARLDRTSILEVLLDAGADLHARARDGGTPLALFFLYASCR